MSECSGNCLDCKKDLFSDKIQDLCEGLFEYEEREYSLPYIGVISLTNRCNLSCPYCFHTQSNLDMDFNTADMAARFLLANAQIKSKKPSIAFFGGEPLIKFEDVLKPLVLKYGDAFSWSITTNGTLLNEEIVDFLTENSVSVLLSIDGCREVQDAQRPAKSGSSFDMVVKNIQYLLLRQPETPFRATLTPLSLKYMDQTLEFIKNCGFKNVNFVPNIFENWEKEDFERLRLFLDSEAIKIMKSIILGESLDYKNKAIINAYREVKSVNEGAPDIRLPRSRCGMGHFAIGISTKGFLHPCQEDNGKEEKDSIGSVFSGIDASLHKKYYEEREKEWKDLIDLLDHRPGSDAFKAFALTGICMNRMKEGYCFNNTHTGYLTLLYKTAGRLYYNFNHSLNPYTEIFEGGVD